MSAVEEVEVCPNCGELVERLEDETGWCDYCTVEAKYGEAQCCLNCGKAFAASQDHKLCNKCRPQRKLGFIAQGPILTNQEVKELLRLAADPVCLTCGEKMRRHTPPDLLCKKNEFCKLVQRKMRKYVYYGRRYSRIDALELALYEVRNLE